MLSPEKLIQNFYAWLHYTLYFRSIAIEVAGKHYSNNRHAIKREIRDRVTSVSDGFDLACQTQLFRSDVFEIAETSRRIELRGKCKKAQVMA